MSSETLAQMKREMRSPWEWRLCFVVGLVASMMLAGYAALCGVHLAGVKADYLKQAAVAALNQGLFLGLVLFLVAFLLSKRKMANPYAALVMALGCVGSAALLLSYLLYGGRG